MIILSRRFYSHCIQHIHPRKLHRIQPTDPPTIPRQHLPRDLPLLRPLPHHPHRMRCISTIHFDDVMMDSVRDNTRGCNPLPMFCCGARGRKSGWRVNFIGMRVTGGGVQGTRLAGVWIAWSGVAFRAPAPARPHVTGTTYSTIQAQVVYFTLL